MAQLSNLTRLAPTSPPPPHTQNTRSTCNGWQRRIKRGMHTMARKEFQILYVPDDAAPLPPGGAGWQALKTVRNEARHYS